MNKDKFIITEIEMHRQADENAKNYLGHLLHEYPIDDAEIVELDIENQHSFPLLDQIKKKVFIDTESNQAMSSQNLLQPDSNQSYLITSFDVMKYDMRDDDYTFRNTDKLANRFESAQFNLIGIH